MPGSTMIGDAKIFVPDGQLVNFCPDNPDEPYGDSLEDRVLKKSKERFYGHAWFDASNGFCNSSDMFATHKELRGTFARYRDATKEVEQTAIVAEVTSRICTLIGVSIDDWQPPSDFVLDAIQDEPSGEDLKEAALKIYVVPVQPSNESSSVGSDAFSTDLDLIRIGHMSTRGGLSNVGSRFRYSARWESNRDHRPSGSRERHENGTLRKSAKTGSQRSRSRGGRHESHSTKYGRQDYRHQFPRIQKKFEWRFAQFLAQMEEFSFPDLEEPDPVEFLSVREQILMSGRNECPTEFDFSYDEYAEMRRIGDEEYTKENVRNERTSRVRRVGSFDPWDLGESVYDHYDVFDDREYQCDCPACRYSDWFDYNPEPMLFGEEAETQRLIDHFCIRDDGDSFADYGFTDHEIDVLQFGHSSRLQLTAHHHKMVGML